MNKETKLLFIAATHGNEGFSISALQRLEDVYPKEKWGYNWIIGNPKALEQEERYTDADLNRVAPGNNNSELYEERRAAELLEIAQDYDMVVDIHGTVSPCDIVKIIPRPSVENFAMTALFPDLINVIWYSARSVEKGPLVQFMRSPAIELECDMYDVDMDKILYQLLVDALLIKQEMTWKRLVTNLSNQQWLKVIGRAECYDPRAQELQPMKTKQGTVYPFLTNQYRNTPYYLTQRINIEDAFLYT